MSPTLLEFAVLIILLVVAWQIGLSIAPSVMRWLRSLREDVDQAAADSEEYDITSNQYKEDSNNGTRR